jgi:hypothetical protein
MVKKSPCHPEIPVFSFFCDNLPSLSPFCVFREGEKRIMNDCHFNATVGSFT